MIAHGRGLVLRYEGDLVDHPRNRVNTDCGAALACDNTVVADCDRICARVRFAVSAAKSVSVIALSAALAFSNATPSEPIVLPRVYFGKAPSRPRNSETCFTAVSTMFLAVTRSSLESELAPPLPSVLRYPRLLVPRLPVETDWIPSEALSVSVTLDPGQSRPAAGNLELAAAGLVIGLVEGELDVQIARGYAIFRP